MAAFSYVGRSVSGAQVKGMIEAVNANAVAEQLSRQGIIPVSINESKDKPSGAIDLANIDIGELLGFSVITLDELIVFCRQMYALVRSGVPILRAINGMAESSTSPKLRSALIDIASQLEGGYALSTALNKHPKIFSPLFISLVHVGRILGNSMVHL